MIEHKQGNSIRTFAVITVAVTSAFVMAMNWWLSDKLADASWCARAINAEKLTAGRSTTAFETCKELLLEQIGSLALNSHIFAGIIALCLLVLIVIVIAGGRVSFSVSKEGASGNIGKDEAEAAQYVADGAQDKADQVKEGGL